MNYYYCSSCNKRNELKYKTSQLESELHMNTEGTVIKNFTIMNPELCEINNILKNIVKNYDKRFELYKNVCKWKLVFNKDNSIDVKSKVMYTMSVFRNNLEKFIENKTDCYRIQGLEFSYRAKMNITFTTSLDFMTYKHYFEQLMPTVGRLINKKLYKNNELIKSLDDIDLTLHMRPYKKGRRDVYDTTDAGQ